MSRKPTFGRFMRALRLRGIKDKDGDVYDYRGFFESNPEEAMRVVVEGGHFPDEFKTERHPTFSDESRRSTPEHEGGRWTTSNNGTDVFVHSDYTKRHADETDDYLGEDYRHTGNVTMSHDGDSFRLPTIEVEGRARRYKNGRSIFDEARGAK